MFKVLFKAFRHIHRQVHQQALMQKKYDIEKKKQD